MAYQVALLLSLVAASNARVGDSTESSFCSETKECLLFDLVCQTADYEVRFYSKAAWVSTDVESYVMEMAVYTGFRRLFDYITGSNGDGVKIDMTAPVLTKVKNGKKMWESSTYTISFLLPSAYQESAPEPTDPKVYFSEMPDSNMYVKTYGAWMTSMTDKLKSMTLTTALDKVEATYNETYHYAVVYNSPMKFLNRHNEVWYLAEGAPVCNTTDGSR